ncbi:Protein kinase-like domain protein [Ophiocordyceps sinensis CO18]|uniref:Protein kinase-like domain protein n=1 Tax=Ophiocordyceps sinensis (strain Co18 / CGMCC 3.14243) TaxID=911162 RepID=T5AH01_OPHSC|nr:Protein kinase-like domain protein [Ophiocordyceps sinensis CO18]
MGLSIGTLFPLRFRLWLGKLLFRSPGPSTVRVSWHRLIKGPCDPPEIEAMQYVASHTTIPVPRIYAVHTEGNGLIYIEMAYVPGDTLDSAWRRGLSTDEKDTICADIKQHISSLRELQPPAQDIVSSALQNPAFDCRIGAQFYGPMNHDEFQSLVRGHLCMEDVPLLGEEVAKVHTSHYQIRFAHADLAPRNIIVRGGRVAAIIDWAFAGWYPEYWEFTKAHYCHIMDDDWEEFLRLALPCYETELTAEQTLSRRLPQPGARSVSFRNGVRHQRPGSKPSAAWLDARAGRQLTDLWSLVRF